MLLVLFLFFQPIRCNWESEWLASIREHSQEPSTQRTKLEDFDIFSEVLPISIKEESYKNKLHPVTYDELSAIKLKAQLMNLLKNCKILTETLKRQIESTEESERLLKEAIVNGRFGVSTVTVSKLERPPHIYIIRDGFWTLCNGFIQTPVSQHHNLFTELFSTPRCIGQEVISRPDPCVFNSMVKYETVPTRRSTEYVEEDYFCLKTNFNNTLEQYRSVPKSVVNDTCKNGKLTTYADNLLKCGLRVLSEYTYYPQRRVNDASLLPLEYCTEDDGSCKLIVAWHLSNTTIENFEFIKSDKNFIRYFLKKNPLIEQDL